jgi:polysaccharide biosynthesis/export protein
MFKLGPSLVVFAFVFMSCGGTKAVNTKVINEPALALQPYKIGPDDELEIFVWKQPEISGHVTVANDGSITIPLAGRIRAAGLTADQVQAAVTKKLGPYMSDPTVTVRVTNAKSQVFFVVGQVLKPGVFRLRPGEVLSQGLAEAGGLGEFADPSAIRIRRRRGDDNEEITVNYTGVQEGQDSSGDIPLTAGDTISVP